MVHPPSSATSSRRRSRAPRPSPSTADFGPEDFPGCEPFHLPAVELERYEGRLEFWDGRTETAWKVCEPTTIDHELPSRRLPWVARALASLRGSEIECMGSADLVGRDALGRSRWLMQADEVLYLHPVRSRPRGSVIDIERDPLPDVVLEVDYTTDVRTRKLAIYMEAGFPEVWVLVPPGSRRAGPARVTIRVRDGNGYRTAQESAAIPGFETDEIFCALTERPWSESTWRAVERVARAMGEREGTGPEDDPLSPFADPRGRGDGPNRRPRGGACRRPSGDAGRDGARGASGAGNRPEPEAREGAGPRRRATGRGTDGGGARVHRRGRLPAPRPGAASLNAGPWTPARRARPARSDGGALSMADWLLIASPQFGSNRS